MSLPQNSTYKKRVISAMLNEQSLEELSMSAPRPTSHTPIWSWRISYIVIGLAILSAACVFLLLYRHDISVLSSAQTLAPGPQFPQKPRNVTVDQKHAVQPQAAIQKLSPISPAGVAATGHGSRSDVHGLIKR